MTILLGLALWSSLLEPGPHVKDFGYLYQPAFRIDDCLREPHQAYCPQPGDIFLASENDFIMKFGHWAAKTGCPQHSGLIFALPCGELALLEAGPHNTLRIEKLDIWDHCHSHEARCERVWIRQRCEPLTPEQSAAMTDFIMEQVGKRFALMRMCWQMSPFCCRGNHRLCYLGKPHGCRHSYFCSELVTESLVAAGVLDPEKARPVATYPRDLFFGRSTNKFLDCNLEINCGWLPPARWTSCPGNEPHSHKKFPNCFDRAPELPAKHRDCH
jgi:hypothetical protein